MKGLPPELIYILIFAAILLFQYLTRRGGRLGPQESPQDEQTPDQIFAEIPEPEQATPAPAALSRASLDDHLRRREPPAALSALPRRRFSRRSLMGNRRAVQNAIVIAAIVGACRAFEPHDVR